MRLVDTQAGRFAIGTREELFAEAAAIVSRAGAQISGRSILLALSGGSTPVEWYRWCVSGSAFSPGLISVIDWFTSDERHVPLSSDDSNFGTADRLLLTPLDVTPPRKHPWPVDLPAASCAREFESAFRASHAGGCFDICFLGLGTDGHTASLFPGGPLTRGEGDSMFAAIEVPGKGWRLTITPCGLDSCGQIVVMALGSGKREALGRVLGDAGSINETPSRILRALRDKVIWLVDSPASEGIPGLQH